MSIKTYQFFCDKCSYKRFTNGNDLQDLVEVKISDIPRGSPVLDPSTKKIVIPPSIKRKKIFKCPRCGFIIKAKQIKEENNEQANKSNGCENSPEGPAVS